MAAGGRAAGAAAAAGGSAGRLAMASRELRVISSCGRPPKTPPDGLAFQFHARERRARCSWPNQHSLRALCDTLGRPKFSTGRFGAALGRPLAWPSIPPFGWGPNRQ